MTRRRLSTLLPILCLVLLWAGAAPATTVLLDGFEDTDYAVSTNISGESIALASHIEHTEGQRSLQLIYNFVAGAQYTKDARITRTFAAPVDLSGMTHLAFDLTVSPPNSGLTLIFVLIDDAGNETRIVPSSILGSAASMKSWIFVSSALSKSRWATGGRAFNLKAVRKFSFRMQNNRDFSEAGTIVLRLDNLRVESQPAMLRGDFADNFEGYADTAALAAVWQPATAGASAELDESSGRALRLRANIAARYTNQLVARDLPAVTDLTPMTHLRLRLFGDTRLSALNPLAKVFLEDTSGNRAIAQVHHWAGVAGWSELYLPLQGEGIEKWASSSSLALGGASCWREDAADAGGWSGNVDMTRIRRVLVGVETLGTGAYPVNGVTLLFDDIRFGEAPVFDTPTVLSNALGTAAAGAVVELGFGSGVFGDGAFLNRAPRMMDWVPGTLVYSDDPESILQQGVLYRTPLPAGISRTYIYHTNESASDNMKITGVLENAGTQTANVVFRRRVVPTPSANYISVGMSGVRGFYENTAVGAPLAIPPGGAALLDPAMDATPVQRFRLMHGIHEFTSDQPLTFTAVMLPSTADTLASLPGLPFSPDDSYKREGTFPHLGRENTVPYEYDTASGIGRIRVADWGADIDPFVVGVDAEDGLPAVLRGNYGVTYTIRVALRSTDGRRVAVLFAPPDTSPHYGGYLRWEFPDAGGAGTGQLVPQSGLLTPGRGGVACRLSPGASGQVLRMETIPAGSMYLPFDILLVPYGEPVSAVEDWGLY